MLDVREGVASVVLRLLFSLFFRDRVAKMLAELESLFEAWRNGTLPPIPEPQPRATHPTTARAPRARQRHTHVRRKAVARILTRAIRPKPATAWQAFTPNVPPDSPVLDTPKRQNSPF